MSKLTPRALFNIVCHPDLDADQKHEIVTKHLLNVHKDSNVAVERALTLMLPGNNYNGKTHIKTVKHIIDNTDYHTSISLHVNDRLFDHISKSTALSDHEKHYYKTKLNHLANKNFKWKE